MHDCVAGETHLRMNILPSVVYALQEELLNDFISNVKSCAWSLSGEGPHTAAPGELA